MVGALVLTHHPAALQQFLQLRVAGQFCMGPLLTLQQILNDASPPQNPSQNPCATEQGVARGFRKRGDFRVAGNLYGTTLNAQP